MQKPFYWKARKGWFHKVRQPNGKYRNVPLEAETEEEAYTLWMRSKRLSKSDPVVADLLYAYSSHQETRVELGEISKATLVRRVDYLASAITYDAMSQLRISQIKPYHVIEWIDTEERWNATTRHFAVQALRGALNWARKMGYIDSNPIAEMTVTKGEPRDFTISDELHQQIVAEVQKGNRKQIRCFATFLIAMRLSGCRPGEVAGLKLSDIQGDTWVLSEHKNKRKTGKKRVVYLGQCLNTLTRIMKHDRTSGPVFRSNYGEGFAYSRARVRFERLRKRIGVDPDCVLYSYRHTKITNDMLAGKDVATVAELHGTSIQMIQKHYGHLSKHSDHLRNAALDSYQDPSQQQGELPQ